MAQSKFDAILEHKREEGEGRSLDAVQGKRGRPAGKRSNPDYAQVTAYIPRALYDEVKILLIRAGGREFSELVEALLSECRQSATAPKEAG